MRHRRALLILVGATIVALTLVLYAPRISPHRMAQAAQHGHTLCMDEMLSRLQIAEAWAWTLCFDQGAACAVMIAAEHSRQVVRGWFACAAQASIP